MYQVMNPNMPGAYMRGPAPWTQRTFKNQQRSNSGRGGRHSEPAGNKEPFTQQLKELTDKLNWTPEYKLLDETPSAQYGGKTYFVRLLLNDTEIYEANGPSIEDAQEKAARVALNNSRSLRSVRSTLSEKDVQSKAKEDGDARSLEKAEKEGGKEPTEGATATEGSGSSDKSSKALGTAVSGCPELDALAEKLSEKVQINVQEQNIGSVGSAGREKSARGGSHYSYGNPFMHSRGRGMPGMRGYGPGHMHGGRGYPGQVWRPTPMSGGPVVDRSWEEASRQWWNLEMAPFRGIVKVGMRSFAAWGQTRQNARQNAVTKALNNLRPIVEKLEKKSNCSGEGTDASGINVPEKNEISWIYEISSKKGITLHSETKRMNGATPDRQFSSRFTAGDWAAEALGCTKKAAKLTAAVRMYEVMKKDLAEEMDKLTTPREKRPGYEKKERISTTPKDTGPLGNDPVTLLTHLRQAQRLPNPTYVMEPTQITTPPTSRVYLRKKEFVMECRMDDLTAQGRGHTKKIAKKASAEAMLIKIGRAPSGTRPQPAGASTSAGDENKTSEAQGKSTERPAQEKRGPNAGGSSNYHSSYQGQQRNQQQQRNSMPMSGLPRGVLYAPDGMPGSAANYHQQPPPSHLSHQTQVATPPVSDGSMTYQQTAHPLSGIPTNQPGMHMKQQFPSQHQQQQASYPHYQHSGPYPHGQMGTPQEASMARIPPPQLLGERRAPDGQGQSIELTPQLVAMEMRRFGYSPLLAQVDVSSDCRPTGVLGGAEQQLAVLCRVFDFKYNFADFPRPQLNEVLSLLTVNTIPQMVISGTGRTVEDAHDAAADSILRQFASNSIQQQATPQLQQHPATDIQQQAMAGARLNMDPNDPRLSLGAHSNNPQQILDGEHHPSVNQ